jgi:hypothetical protein
MRRPWPTGGLLSPPQKKKCIMRQDSSVFEVTDCQPDGQVQFLWEQDLLSMFTLALGPSYYLCLVSAGGKAAWMSKFPQTPVSALWPEMCGAAVRDKLLHMKCDLMTDGVVQGSLKASHLNVEVPADLNPSVMTWNVWSFSSLAAIHNKLLNMKYSVMIRGVA